MSGKIAQSLIDAGGKLSSELAKLEFSPPVTCVYNPLVYASASHEEYLRRYAATPKRVLFLGMNPGPWGMAQTGVPFGEVDAVRSWMRIEAPVGRPPEEHPKRPIEGFACERSEVSGRRLWGLMQRRFGDAERFFEEHFVANYCPLIFLEEGGRNRTPDKLPVAERSALFDRCDDLLRTTIELLRPEWLVGVGKFAESRLAAVADPASGVTVVSLLHPSPASPRANRGWAEAAESQLTASGVWP